MRIKLSDIDVALRDLRFSLTNVTHPGLLLVWIWEYLQVLYSVPVSVTEASMSRRNCTESLPNIYAEFLDALADFRNSFVHRGPVATKEELYRFRHVNVPVIKDLFELAQLPEHARYIYWKWFEGGANIEDI